MSCPEYRELPPPTDLEAAVECVWTLRERGGAGRPERVLPDGRVEIVLNLADRFERLAGGAAEPQPAALLVGPTTRHMQIRPTGDVDLVGIRLRPGGAVAILGEPLSSLADRSLPLADVLQSGDRLLERVGNQSAEGRCEELWRQLRTWVRDAGTDDPATAAACRLLLESPGLPVAEVAHRVGLSPRTLRRRFLRRVGTGPKRLARLARFQRAVAALTAAGAAPAPWLDAGYADQSHFVREFGRLAGVPPGAYFAGGDNRLAVEFVR